MINENQHINIWMKNLFIYLLFPLLLSSCGAKYLTIVDQVLPARISFPDGVRSVTVLDRAKQGGTSIGSGSGVTFGQSNNQLLRNCAGRLPVSASVNSQGLRDSRHGSPAPRMNSEEVRRYVGAAHGLFCLDQLFFQEERRMVEYDKHQLDENGKDYYIKAVRATKVSSLDALWRLYDGRSGAVLMELPYSLEDVFEAEALDYESANTKLDTLHQVDPNTMAREIVDRLIADVSPTPIESNWLYYTKGNDLVERSAGYLEARNYDAAARIIEKNQRLITQLKKPQRAQYNWATALFLAGDSRAAERVAREGHNRFGDSEFLQLIQKINTYD